jgi:ribulose-phosphate 3-epimerase
MCINFNNLDNEINELNLSGISGYHIDIMDGNCVPNFALGLNDIYAVSKLTNLELDVHLMGINPEKQIDPFLSLPIDKLSFHYEFAKNHMDIIDKIKSSNIKVGLVINPSTSLLEVSHLLTAIDFLLIMTVNPGFAGQKYIEGVTNKIAETILYRNKHKLKFEIDVDGAISLEKVHTLSLLGVDSFVLGTAGLFNKNFPNYKHAINEMVNNVSL